MQIRRFFFGDGARNDAETNFAHASRCFLLFKMFFEKVKFLVNFFALASPAVSELEKRIGTLPDRRGGNEEGVEKKRPEISIVQTWDAEKLRAETRKR